MVFIDWCRTPHFGFIDILFVLLLAIVQVLLPQIFVKDVGEYAKAMTKGNIK